MYWDIEKTLSYGRFLNLINGNRGGGKTYGSKKWIIKHFLKTKNKFVWVRRYKQEFRGNEKFFGKVQWSLRNLEFLFIYIGDFLKKVPYNPQKLLYSAAQILVPLK